MARQNRYLLSAYQELEPLCEKGHVVLVQNTEDGQLYVKKKIISYAPELYWKLYDDSIDGIPSLYGIYEDPESNVPVGAAALILIEEYLPGHTLAQHIREDGLFSDQKCIDIGMQICSILMELHGRKPAIVHRDIKPSNVMLLPDGSVRLIDFNAAKVESSMETRDTVLIGTAGFAAPEQYGFSASTPQTDLYALGVLMNTMLTGTLPWERQTNGRLRSIISRCMKNGSETALCWGMGAKCCIEKSEKATNPLAASRLSYFALVQNDPGISMVCFCFHIRFWR